MRRAGYAAATEGDERRSGCARRRASSPYAPTTEGSLHELALAQAIVELAAERAGGAKVIRVVVEVGKLAAVLPESLAFSFDAACAGTPLEGAALEVVSVPGEGRCRACGGRLALDRPIGLCACGSSDVEWVSGADVRVRELGVVA